MSVRNPLIFCPDYVVLLCTGSFCWLYPTGSRGTRQKSTYRLTKPEHMQGTGTALKVRPSTKPAVPDGPA